MGIDIYCAHCHEWLGKQCFSYRRELLDALRAYLVSKKATHDTELEYVNWLYRDEDDDKHRVVDITDEKRTQAKKLLKEKNLDGLFCWTFLQEDDYITWPTAKRFIESYKIIKDFMKDRTFIDGNIFAHAVSRKHNLRCS
jgi:hypothetical protein